MRIDSRRNHWTCYNIYRLSDAISPSRPDEHGRVTQTIITARNHLTMADHWNEDDVKKNLIWSYVINVAPDMSIILLCVYIIIISSTGQEKDLIHCDFSTSYIKKIYTLRFKQKL